VNISLEKRMDEIERKLEEGAANGNSVNTDTKSYASVVIGHTISELNDREERSRNVVIVGLTESTSTDTEERKRHDREAAMDVFRQIGSSLEAGDIERVFRTGKQQDRPRLMVVGLSSTEKRTEILKKTKQSTNLRGIKVRPDLTKAEREQEKTFFMKLDEAKKSNPGMGFRVYGPPGQRKFVKTTVQMTTQTT